MPEIKGPIALVISRIPYEDLQPGVHRIPDTSVYVSGYLGDAMQVGAWFGAIGQLAALGAAQKAGERKVASVSALRMDVIAIAERALAEHLHGANPTRFVTGGPRDATFEITPYLVMATTGNDQMRPWVCATAVLKDTGMTETWRMSYVVDLGVPRALEGPHGWVQGDGSTFRLAVEQGLRTAIATLMRDASGSLPRLTGRDVKVKTQWMWSKEWFEFPAEVLDETKDAYILASKRGASSVVAVMDKRSVSIRDDRE
jgi:hypothetical protein